MGGEGVNVYREIDGHGEGVLSKNSNCEQCSQCCSSALCHPGVLGCLCVYVSVGEGHCVWVLLCGCSHVWSWTVVLTAVGIAKWAGVCGCVCGFE